MNDNETHGQMPNIQIALQSISESLSQRKYREAVIYSEWLSRLLSELALVALADRLFGPAGSHLSGSA